MWSPLLPPAARPQSLRIASSIVDELVGTAGDVGDPWSASQRALLAWEFGRLTGESRHEANAEAIAERAAELTAMTTMDRQLIKGVVGVAWIFDTLEDDHDSDHDSELDEMVGAVASHEPRPEAAYLDLISGLVGAGVYFLNRPDTPANRRHLEAIVYRLEETAEYLDDGVAWWARSIFGPETILGGYNLGLAHGVPGIVAFLARALQRGVSVERTGALLDGAVRWLLGQQLASGPSRYATIVTPSGPDGPARSAWCYGDPGVAMALFAAAAAAGRDDWRAAAVDVALHAAVRPLSSCGVVDACVCHGAAGLLHMFNRFYQATGDRRFAEAALRWVGPTHELLGRDRWDGVPQAPAPAHAKASNILEGKVGIALALLSATSSVAPRWDRLLLADLPIRAHSPAMEIVA